MELRSEFEYDFFESTPEESASQSPSKYEAKVCQPFWFMESKQPDLSVLKHSADIQFFAHNYAEAAKTYERCLDLLPAQNTTWRREFMENLAKCALHNNQAEKALEWSLKLDECSFSSDQKITSMNLLASVCHCLKKYEEELEALHGCIEAHKSCPEFWQRLALCYAGLFKIYLPEFDSDSEAVCENCRAFKPDGPRETLVNPGESREWGKCELCTLGTHIVSSCLIHTRILIDSEEPSPLGKDRDEKIKEKIDKSLKHMGVDQSFIDVASQMLGSDFLSGLKLPCFEEKIESVHDETIEIGDKVKP